MIELLFVFAVFAAVVLPFLNFLVRRDRGAVHAVMVDSAAFAAGELPSICCKTGAPAETGVAVSQRKWFKTVAEGIIPITNAQFGVFSKWKGINGRTKIAAFGLYVLSFPLQMIESLETLELVWVLAFFAALVTASVSGLIAHRCLAAPRVERDGSVMLRGVHPAFVVAVQESRRDARPAATADTP